MGFENVSWQHATYAQQRSYSIHAKYAKIQEAKERLCWHGDIIITKEQSTFPVSETSPVMATFCLTGLFVASDRSAVMMVQPAEGPSFGVAPYQQTINKKRQMK